MASDIVNIVLPVFLIILAGFIFGKIKKINISALVDFSVYIAVPCLVFHSVSQSIFVPGDFSALFFAVAAVILISGLLAKLWFSLAKIKASGLYLPLMFPNTGNVGFPIVLFALGKEGLSNAVVYSTFTSLFIFSLGVYIVAKKANFREIFKLPLIYAVILGILFSVYSISLPKAVGIPIEYIGMAAIPLQLIVLGYSLSTVKFSYMRLAAQGALFKLAVGFGIAFAFISLFNIGEIAGKVILLQSMMPSALFSILLTQKYKRDSELVASTVLMSTLLAMIALPFVLKYFI